NRFRRARGIGRADSLVRVLSRLLAAELARLLGHVIRAQLGADPRPHLPDRFAGEARRVGTHVGDETHAARGAEGDALVELLGDGHGALTAEPEAIERRLLERAGDERRLRMHLT